MQGGTLNCQGFPCKQNIVSLTRHRRLAGRDPTARRWSPKAKSIMPLLRAAFPGLGFIYFMHFMVKCICSFVCSFVCFVDDKRISIYGGLNIIDLQERRGNYPAILAQLNQFRIQADNRPHTDRLFKLFKNFEMPGVIQSGRRGLFKFNRI